MILNNWQITNEEFFELLKVATDQSWAGVLIVDANLKPVYCNDVYESICGYSPEAIQSMNVDEIALSTAEGVSSSFNVLNTGKESLVHQRSLITGKNYLAKSFPFFDKDGNIKYVITNLLNVSQLSDIQSKIEALKEIDSIDSESIRRFLDLLAASKKDSIIYKSKIMDDLLKTVNLISKTDATVLIQGESGTGKELFAKQIHNNSDRKNKPYMVINCGAIPESLLESELFGYEPGTFTGGNPKGKVGLLEAADGGTLFLDEIGDMPLALQAKLLRPLQDREVVRLGGRKIKKVDVRFIAATNLNLPQQVEKKQFREDLFYRLNVAPIQVPALRDRFEDIPLLSQFFINQYNEKYNRNKILSENAMEYLMAQSFPGNVRQLKNLMERACIVTTRSIIDTELLQKLYYDGISVETPTATPFKVDVSGSKSLDQMTGELERQILSEYLKKYGSTHKMAEALHTSQSTISRKLHKYGITP